jgi:hypothetical protein
MSIEKQVNRGRKAAISLIRGAAPAKKLQGPHMPPGPPRSHRLSRMLTFCLGLLWGVGASEEQLHRTGPHL